MRHWACSSIFNDAPYAIFWTDYVATRWYRASELCGSFLSNVSFISLLRPLIYIYIYIF
ncbi:putative mitogen-activated protein kinase [Rosa chinensis]|uniref:Putative mitogen-activated protein kinase n=1 Tax=Rosa chinensis TaxID=74649 RepID=A0A2P6R0V8_ROSCH|nr:putative mitogen-activated protein kinase [Rosa chinensis]